MTDQAQPFDEALLGDLTLEHQLFDRARYLKALAAATQRTEIEALAFRLITAHSATVDWLTTVLAEDGLGGPAALRRTPMHAVAGTGVRWINTPVSWSARGLDRAIDTARAARPRLEALLGRGAHAGDVAVKTLTASRDAVLQTAEEITRRAGATAVAEVIHSARTTVGVLEPGELPIGDYDDLTVAAVKDLTDPADIRAVAAYGETHKRRHGVVSAARARLAAIAQEFAGIT